MTRIDPAGTRRPRGHAIVPPAGALLLVLLAACAGCGRGDGYSTTSGSSGSYSTDRSDEAQAAGYTQAYFKPPPEVPDYFQDMDTVSIDAKGEEVDAWPDQLLDKAKAPRARKVAPLKLLDKEGKEGAREVLGRNTWMMWCGGNEGFWDWLATHSYGFMDFLKLVDTHKRPTRWRDAGMTNEPGMRQAAEADEWGLWLDEPDDPQLRADRKRAMTAIFDEIERTPYRTYPTTQPGDYEGQYNGYYKRFDKKPLDARIPPPTIYGFSSGVIGLRLFPNPMFRGEARTQWMKKLEAEKDWKKTPGAYYTDEKFFSDPKLIRPFRVGMSCAFCHVTVHPLRPPADPARPAWENISGNIGAQYLRTRAVVGGLLSKENLVYHILDSQPPGTIDTSLVASDNINNPNAMNAIFGIPARLVRSFENPRELSVGAAAGKPWLWPDPIEANTPEKYRKLLPKLAESNKALRHVPRVLFDGADSVGAYVALARVYLNIGTFYEQWIRIHDPLLGLSTPADANHEDRRMRRTQLPFRIDDCEKYSTYWKATEDRVPALRDYFLRITAPMPLADAHCDDDQKPYARIDKSKLALGRRVFVRNCIVCHSSIQPESDFTVASDKDFQTKHKSIRQRRTATTEKWEAEAEPWDHEPGQWLCDAEYLKWGDEVVEDPTFWAKNFLSTDLRVPVNYVGTNSGRAMATNATNGHMWEDFSSLTNRSLHSIGSVAYFNPYTGQDALYTPRHRVQGDAPAAGGGPGFYRPSSLISIWATAPFLHNNSLGHFNNDPSVKGRMEAFDDAIHKLLYKERRLETSDYATREQLARDHGLIWRTPCDTWVNIPAASVPLALQRLPFQGTLAWWSGVISSWGPRWIGPTFFLLVGFALLWFKRGAARAVRLSRYAAYLLMVFGLFVGFIAYLNTGGFGDLRIGPIPAGTPVNLIANINAEEDQAKLTRAIFKAADGLVEIQSRHLVGEEKDKVLKERVAPALLEVSKCPDFVMDKGHYYPWFNEMSAEDKEALIELLKTF